MGYQPRRQPEDHNYQQLEGAAAAAAAAAMESCDFESQALRRYSPSQASLSVAVTCRSLEVFPEKITMPPSQRLDDRFKLEWPLS
jgi:hypothetical protein